MTRDPNALEGGAERLAQHAADCDECREATPPLGDIVRTLSSYATSIDAAALSRRVLAALRPELTRLASIWFWRRLARGLLAALVPLPLIVLFDAYVLSNVYEWVSGLLPTVVATYLVASYGALLFLLFGATYAAIPLVLARDAWIRSVAPTEATS